MSTHKKCLKILTNRYFLDSSCGNTFPHTGNGGGILERADGTGCKGFWHKRWDYTGEPDMHTRAGRGVCKGGVEFHGGNENARKCKE